MQKFSKKIRLLRYSVAERKKNYATFRHDDMSKIFLLILKYNRLRDAVYNILVEFSNKRKRGIYSAKSICVARETKWYREQRYSEFSDTVENTFSEMGTNLDLDLRNLSVSEKR